jgi:hypothetical protein
MMALLFVFITAAQAQPVECSHMEVWDYTTAMCQPLPMKGMPMRMLMWHGNSFFTQIWQEGRRGENAFAVPNMFMLDMGSSLGDRHYINWEVMGTVERWTFPKRGYPEFLQIGEEDEDHRPYLDAQHPHSSPIMGLTLSDTIAIGGRDFIKIWFAPRGSSTDGPVPFMHRPTGMVNPDAPLGHHIGQDAGHISSTVIGAEARLNSSTLEVSSFHGQEPEPAHVDLPMGTPDSFAARFTQQFTPNTYAMASFAYVQNPEPHDSDLKKIWRYSASLYDDRKLSSGWSVSQAWIWGVINGYDEASALTSLAQETWLRKGPCGFWNRFEVLQRTAEELDVGLSQDRQWVTALTLGYTHELHKWENAELALGLSLGKDFLPARWRSAYGGDPLTGKVFVQLSGMGMQHY